MNNENSSFIIVQDLVKHYNSGSSKVEALNGVSFEIPKGKFVILKGASGSGKTTLLYLLGALEKATSGKIVVGNYEVTSLSSSQENEYRLKKVGFIFQNYYLIPTLNAIENVMLPMELAGEKNAKEKAKALLERVGISGAKQTRLPTRLSGGEQQRVAIARALANDPELILADEPTGNLDSKTGRVIIDMLSGFVKDGKTVIVATHDEGIAKKGEIVIELRDGKIV